MSDPSIGVPAAMHGRGAPLGVRRVLTALAIVVPASALMISATHFAPLVILSLVLFALAGWTLVLEWRLIFTVGFLLLLLSALAFTIDRPVATRLGTASYAIMVIGWLVGLTDSLISRLLKQPVETRRWPESSASEQQEKVVNPRRGFGPDNR